MKQEVCLLPVRCRSCGSKFDLWHELQEQESLRSLREQSEIEKLINQWFCWHCRKAVSGELEMEEDNAEEEESSEESEIVQTELNLSLAY